MSAPAVPVPAPTQVGPAGHPALNPALRRLWRSETSLQLGIDPRRAHVIDGLTPADERLLDLLDGSRPVEVAAALAGCDQARADSVVAALGSAGALSRGVTDPRAVPASLLPDALAAGLACPHDTGAGVVLRRSLRRVDVAGAGRVGATLAALLAAAGVGTVHCVDPEPCRPADAAPGGLPRTPGGRREAAAGRLVAAARSQPSAGEPPARPDLVVLAPVEPATPPELAATAAGAPHLEVVVRDTTALVGPLVVPGRTACRRCSELARADRDPAWPLLATQLATPTRRVEACDLTLATVAAALTALHVLRWLDDAACRSREPAGGRRTATHTAAGLTAHPLTDAVVEICGRTGATRRRAVHPHPDCGCGAAG